MGIALAAVLGLGVLAAPAMAGTALVNGTTLEYRALAAGEINNLTVVQNGDSYTLEDATITAGSGCALEGSSAICSADPPITAIRINVGDGDDTVVVSASTPAEILGRAGNDDLTGGSGADLIDGFTGNDLIHVEGDGAGDRVLCGDGSDSVTSDRGDDVRPDCEANDDGVFPTTTILAGPLGPAGNTNPRFDFTADESPVQFFCSVAPAATPSDQLTWSGCDPSTTFDAPTEGDWVFRVYAQDSIGAGGIAELPFTVDTQAPVITISGPASPIRTPTPTFHISAEDETSVRFECSVDGAPFEGCNASYTTEPLADGDHLFQVRGTDRGRNETIADFPFRISVPGDNGVTPPSTTAGTPVTPRRIIIDSLVLISGSTVRMSRRGVVGIRLTCAGRLTCKGRMKITTAKPVRRKSKRLVTLGSKQFRIGANKKRKIKVRFSKSKRRLARRLKRFRAKVVISEVDQRGNPRISSRLFTLRAR